MQRVRSKLGGQSRDLLDYTWMYYKLYFLAMSSLKLFSLYLARLFSYLFFLNRFLSTTNYIDVYTSKHGKIIFARGWPILSTCLCIYIYIYIYNKYFIYFLFIYI